jgi:hypothetical protein
MTETIHVQAFFMLCDKFIYALVIALKTNIIVLIL